MWLPPADRDTRRSHSADMWILGSLVTPHIPRWRAGCLCGRPACKVQVQLTGPYLIFVISFTQAAFSNSKFYTWKLTKNTEKCPWKVKYMQFLCSIWKILHLTEYFYTGTAHSARNNYQVCSQLLKTRGMNLKLVMLRTASLSAPKKWRNFWILATSICQAIGIQFMKHRTLNAEEQEEYLKR